jgi:hypothetical protein
MEWYRQWQRYARKKGIPIRPIPAWAHDVFLVRKGENNVKKTDTSSIPKIVESDTGQNTNGPKQVSNS